MPENNRQSPTPSQGGEGSDLRSIASQVEGLLDGDGHFNPNPDTLSRGHPDYDVEKDDRNKTDRDDRGRFKKKAAADDGGEIETVAESDETLDIPAVEDDQDTDIDGNDDTEDQEISADNEADSDDTDTETINTLEELALAIDIPLEEFKAQITHSFRAADEDLTVTLAELEKGYQKDADYRRGTGQLAEDKRAFQADMQLRMQDFEKQNALLAQNFVFTEQALAAELNDPRLADLRNSDPAEWTARREEILGKVQLVRNAYQQAAANYDEVQLAHLKDLKQREQTALTGKVPDWSDGHRDLVKDTMASIGYGADEINNVFDHRLIVGALELGSLRKEVEELRALKDKAKNTVKRVKKDVPKLQKPGKQRMQSGAKVGKDNLARLRKRAQKSGTINDAALVIEQII